MPLYRDLLEQARHLATREPRRPRQASLRRATSTAYYALFHLLTGEATRAIRPAEIRDYVRRVLSHDGMRGVCKAWSVGRTDNLPAQTRELVRAPIEQQLSSVAATFVDLQEARHAADYDVVRNLTKMGAGTHIDDVQQAFANWEAVRGRPNAAIFLAALLFEKQWRR